MTNQTYFIGTEFDALNPISFNQSFETGGLGIDQTMRGAVDCSRNGGYDIILRDFSTTGNKTAVSNIWLHFRGRLQDNPDRPDWIQFFGPSDTAVVRMETRDNYTNGYIRMTYWNGTAWTPIGDWYNGYHATDQRTFDIHVKIGSAGKLEYFIDGISCYSQTLDTSALGNISRIRLGPSRFDYGGTWFGEVIAANYSTIGHRVRHRYPTGNGTYTDWTGDYTAVDEFAAADNDMIFTDTVGSRESYTSFAIPDDGLPIKAVAVAARIRCDDESTVRAVRPLLVINGNEYTSPAPIPGSPGLKGTEWVFDKNPATNGDWTFAQVNAAEFGVKASDGGSN